MLSPNAAMLAPNAATTKPPQCTHLQSGHFVDSTGVQLKHWTGHNVSGLPRSTKQIVAPELL